VTRRHCERSDAIQKSSSGTAWIALLLRSSQ
jgi:hypothetical protein